MVDSGLEGHSSASGQNKELLWQLSAPRTTPKGSVGLPTHLAVVESNLSR
jgi:hypothetical protein